jgi:hypothetical protein
MAASVPARVELQVEELTLLDLVQAVSISATSEVEVVATVLHLIRSGRVRLCGNFRGSLLEDA